MTEHIRLIPVGGALSTDEESSHHPMVHMEIKRFQQHAKIPIPTVVFGIDEYAH